ncbi:DUF6625 family protein [Winogradskyella helgolandensis]|uniref:DUF6625 family protein n=1 Tax=Winogradskyella helgolandensis TaxID=2697010 RepID=UPI0015BA1377|nr:DUF6625 family protein [Winogradskyella helgolandensis]
MNSIILIIPYFGKWPLWFDAFLKSCEANPTIQWFCPTDCVLPKAYPANITFFPTTLEDLNKHVNQVVSANVPLSPRKFCDLKPAYADIFAKQVSGYNFWGICDMDIIWGDIRKFMTQDILEQYDIISSRKEAISGHFNLFRNTPEINALYKQLPDYKTLFEVPEFKWTDEVVLTQYLKEHPEVLVYWPNILCNQERGRDSHQEYHLDRWQWQNGTMINAQTQDEVMYLHFINWKRTMRCCNINFTDTETSFFISNTGMHYQPHTKLEHLLNRFKNVLMGYWVQEKRRKRKLKIKSLKKRIKRKFNI